MGIASSKLGRARSVLHEIQSPAVLVKPEGQLRSGSPETVPVKCCSMTNGSPLLDSRGQQLTRMGIVVRRSEPSLQGSPQPCWLWVGGE
jgi:hypothetical protein